MPAEEQRLGLFATLHRMADAVLGLAQNRLRLFSLEFETEKLRLLDALLKTAVVLGILGIGVFMVALALAVFAWRLAGYAGLLILAALFLGAGAFLLSRLRRELRSTPPPFEKTMSEFDKDHACLTRKD
jgi:uncharacterized membrane protein YqjE